MSTINNKSKPKSELKSKLGKRKKDEESIEDENDYQALSNSKGQNRAKFSDKVKPNSINITMILTFIYLRRERETKVSLSHRFQEIKRCKEMMMKAEKILTILMMTRMKMSMMMKMERKNW